MRKKIIIRLILEILALAASVYILAAMVIEDGCLHRNCSGFERGLIGIPFLLALIIMDIVALLREPSK